MEDVIDNSFFTSSIPKTFSESNLININKKSSIDSSKAFNFTNNIYLHNITDIRKKNNFLSKENKKLKKENTIIEQNITNQNNIISFNGNDLVNLMKKKIKYIRNNNDILVYKLLNEVKDIYLLNNNIYKNKYIYNSMKMPVLDINKIILTNKKEELQLKIAELRNRKKNLDILHNSVLQKIKDNKEIITKLNNIIEQINYKNNFIYDSEEIYQKINLLLNEKQKLTEENINMMNRINFKRISKKDEDNKNYNEENQEIISLRNKNKKLKNKINKYNEIINKTNLLLNNSSIKKSLEKYKNINKEVINETQKNENINKDIENMINKFKNEIHKKDEIIEKLKNEYLKLNKKDMNSIDGVIL